MTARARLAEVAAVLAFVGAVAIAAVVLPYEGRDHVLLLVALTLGYAAIQRAEFEIGPGYASPDVVLFVPMLFLIPLPLVLVVVGAASVLSRVPELFMGKVHADRLIPAVSDAWFAVGPVIVLGLAGAGEPDANEIGIYALAFAAQAVTMAGPALLLEWVDKGVAPRDSLDPIAWSIRIDAILWPIGLMAAFAAEDSVLLLLALVPLAWLLSVFSRERHQRHAAALELNRAYRGTVMLLSDVVEADDNYTADHSRSVVELVVAVADELEIHDDDRQELEFAALLHDVGKITIPKEILHKPGKLTDDEFELMKTHTVEGQQMLDRVGGLLGRVGGIVRCCHERWDGAGYPDGLAGELIPLPARIVFCCDAYNAMTTTRVYRKAMPVEEALTELRENAGSQFDPLVVAGLTRVIERGYTETRPTPAEAVAALFRGRDEPPALKAC
ncbi:MAG: HD-GYP domain-containing protein [Thermoleophilaceae bacterium]